MSCRGLRALGIGALASVVAGCAHVPTYEAKALAPAELSVVREQVRGYAKTHCGACHQSTLPTAKPAALRIYDLDSADWSSTITAPQLRGGFPRRLNGQLDDAGRERLRAFIEAELALR